ncbi:c(7)-type cytochrome triheme domain-containing protein [uncultured Desulfuromonas sp.]|uniref:c(7)-type cytochrome triheme domain-containing protein n=1 Tax=uncultured Desulfuromonas sp. TaxID=181013 RepID=UPI00261D6D29|nr:c(7)-type cytochrome triheme domain-containing protein [uncultured Desulfuromonas sp.]
MKKLIRILICAALATGLVAVQQGFAEDDFGGGEITYKSTVFSHESHVGGMGFDCDTCHEGLFEMEGHALQGNPEFSMDAIYEGGFCGTCHDGDTAFASDSDCTSCHVKDGGDIYYTEPVKAILFSHKAHGETGLECESCHTGLFGMEALAAQKGKDFTMAALYDGQYCGACHDGDTAFASDTRCATCHVGVKGYVRAHPSKGGDQHAAH